MDSDPYGMLLAIQRPFDSRWIAFLYSNKLHKMRIANMTNYWFGIVYFGAIAVIVTEIIRLSIAEWKDFLNERKQQQEN